MEEIFNNLILTLKNEQPDIKVHCEKGMNSNYENIEPWNNEEKELCRNMMSVMLYTNGLTQNLTVRNKVDGEDIVDTYLRCVVGNAVLVELYGSNCRFEKVLPHVSGMVGGMVDAHLRDKTDEKCSAFNREDARIGGKLISQTIKEWIDEGGWKSDKNVRNYTAIEKQGENCNGQETSGKGRKETEGEDENEEGKDIEEKVSGLKDIMDAGKTVSQEGADEVVKKMDPNDSEDEMRRKLESEIQSRVKEEKAEAQKAALSSNPKQVGDDCKEENLCKRANCVTTQWFKIRKDASIGNQNWCNFWDYDVNNRLKQLSSDMTNGNGSDDNLCKKVNREGKVATEAEKTACQYITKGLKHIYEVQVDSENRNQDQARSNRPFYQTMACVLLNTYADKFKEKNPTCITEYTIKKAFEIGNSKMSAWCVDTNGKSNDCVTCTRDTSYVNCTLSVDNSLWTTTKSTGGTCKKDGNNIKEEMDGLFQNNTEITASLTSINNNFCTRIKCVAEKWRWHREKKGNAYPDWLSKFWEPDVKNELGRLSKDIVDKNKATDVDGLCENIKNVHNGMEESNKAACNYIVKGLEHIYKITKGKDSSDHEMVLDNQIFHRTMSCALLNAFADKLEQLKPCSPKAGVEHAFNAGKSLFNQLCTQKNDANCVECTREHNFKGCEIVDTTKKNRKDKVEEKVNELLGKDDNIKKTLSTISSLNKTLCKRAQCVAHTWREIRKTSEGKYPEWNTMWGNQDIGRLLSDLSNAMNNKDATIDNHCENINGTDGTVYKEANRKACQFIVKGLKNIYKIGTTEGDNNPEENKQFNQTISCFLLNVYADILENQNPCKPKEGVNKAFSFTSQIKEGTKCEDDPTCFECTRDTSFKDCKINVKTDRQTIAQRMKGMLNSDGGIKTTLQDLCPKPPSELRERSEEVQEQVPVPAPSATDPDNSPATVPKTAENGQGKCTGRDSLDGGVKLCASVPIGVKDTRPASVDISTPAVARSDDNDLPPGVDISIFKDSRITLDQPPLDPSSGVQLVLRVTRVIQVSLGVLLLVQVVVIPVALVNLMLVQVEGASASGGRLGRKGGGGGKGALKSPQVVGVGNVLKERVDLLTPYLPVIPVFIGISAMTYLLWKYFTRGKRRRRHRREEHLTSYPLEEQFLDHVDDQDDGPHEYTLIKKRRQPRSTPTGRTKRPEKRAGRRGVGRRMIIDIHLEVLDECQRGDTQLAQNDFFEILVREFMGIEFIKEKNVPNVNVPNEEVPSSDSEFRV
ncbi:SICA antigen [Plasmodium coatneyi]|uniref:SICA antigen n=1 Tax=Plasmodium coatneyi TaxID=208452 RepID=A0A1B1E163_9APIC|nr:SICA antigen [Plasmodium coatneyi]ANQ08768.1 SICA antigen [Plasmodium coatneyi]